MRFSLSENSDSGTSEFALYLAPPVTNEICVICGEFGKDKELWFRCIECASWADCDKIKMKTQA